MNNIIIVTHSKGILNNSVVFLIISLVFMTKVLAFELTVRGICVGLSTLT